MEQIPKLLKGPFQQLSSLKINNARNALRPLKDYFAIGFDVDHCLVRYRTKEIFPILCNSLYQVLIEKKGYPQNITDFNTIERNFFMNGLVIDLKTGNILKLGEGKIVLRAYFGLERLSQNQIEKFYGSPPVFNIFDANNPFNNDYFCCLSFFECYFPLVFAKMVEYKRRGRDYLTKEEVKGILDDGFYAVGENYSHATEEIYRPILQFGHYYKSVIDNIDKVIYKGDNMLSILKRLKAQGKSLFLVSDSHYEYVGSLMEYAYGKDWLNIFDYALLNAKKPSFFHSKTRLFREIDMTKPNKMGVEVAHLNKNQLYTAGNAGLLEKNIRDSLKVHADKKILYIGDHYCYDILASKELENWDSVCIMEELEGLDMGEDYDGRIWGHWQYEETSKGIIPTFWYNEMIQKADRCVPLVDSKAMNDIYYGDEEPGNETK